MEGKALWQFYYFLLFLALAFGPSTSGDVFPGKKHFVRIVNNLNNKPLDFSCRSADDVINRSLPTPGTQFQFGFRAGASTYWKCGLSTVTSHVEFKAFIAEDPLIDECGGVHCIWSARDDGIYLYRIKKDDFVKKYDWILNQYMKNASP